MNTESNLQAIIAPFPKWSLKEADGNWCAAFVYYCCRKAGIPLPYHLKECKTCNLAGCIAWEEWAMEDERIRYERATNHEFVPQAGDIVLYDDVFDGGEHDHIGIVLENKVDSIIAAEGNINNLSGILERKKDRHIRAYIRIPNDFLYE